MIYNCAVFMICTSVCFAHWPRSKAACTSPLSTHSRSPAKPLSLASSLLLHSRDRWLFSCGRRENAQRSRNILKVGVNSVVLLLRRNLTVSALPVEKSVSLRVSARVLGTAFGLSMCSERGFLSSGGGWACHSSDFSCQS